MGTGRAMMPSMRMRRAAVVSVVCLVAACSSSEDDGLNPQPLPPQEGQGGQSPAPPGRNGGATSADANCTGTCCQQPAEGSACIAGTDTTCSWAVTCPSGLVLPYEITCTNGAWQLTNGCPAEGASDDRGCPASNPQNGTPCPSTGTFIQCGYVLECTGYRKSTQATCSNNGTGSGFVWTSTPLGTCD